MKKILILGGTGTLGRSLTDKLLRDPVNHITVYSRCELKQKEMEAQFRSKNLRFIIGDIRDKDHLIYALNGVHTAFHVAALKHIDSLEDNPEESVKTNILGTINVADASIYNRVKFVAFSSTDKAVDPINVYGMCKGISEKILFRRNELQEHTYFSVYRWGNVLGSRGSAIQNWARSLKNKKSVDLTHADMTRFWITIEDAVDFMLDTITLRRTSAKIPPIKAASVTQVINVTASILGISKYKFNQIGIRKGEKMHEALTSHVGDGNQMVSNSHEQYTDKELVRLLTPIVSAAS